MIAPPPRLQDLRAGTVLHAGLGFSEILPTWDVETYSEAGYEWIPPNLEWLPSNIVYNQRTGKFVEQGNKFVDRGSKWKVIAKDSKGRPGLFAVGAAHYTEHPSCDLLCFNYDLKDGHGPECWEPGQPLPQRFIDHVRCGGILEAHNASFERWVYRNVLVKRYGFPPLSLRQQRCSMAKARAYALPGGLAPLGEVLKLSVQKDGEGKRLLDKFSKPHKPSKKDPRTRILMADEPADHAGMLRYNAIDVATESEASSLIPDLPELEQEYWFIDQAINDRGVHVDRAGVMNCITIIEQAHKRYNGELRQITGYIERASMGAKIIEWLRDQGLVLAGLDDEIVSGTLKRMAEAEAAIDQIDDTGKHAWYFGLNQRHACRRVLEIRAAVASASVKKAFAIRNQLTEADRLHDLFSFHAARTGRPTGNGPQPTNMPNSGPEVFCCAACGRWSPSASLACTSCRAVRGPHVKVEEWCINAVEQALEDIASRSLEHVEARWGDAMGVVSGCLRALFTAAEGHDLICSDYTAIEAVVNAQLSGEQWRIDVFNGHGKIYEASAASMFGLQLQELLDYKLRTGNHHPLRKKGKVAELALGYLGWIGALYDMGGYEGSEEEAKELCKAWRNANPNIVWLGGGQGIGFGRTRQKLLHGLEGMAISAIQQPGVSFPVMRKDGTHSGLTMLCAHSILHMFLPSGRSLKYHKPRLTAATGKNEWRGLQISYEGWNTNPKNGMSGWIRMSTYAGKLLENACQAVANDILRFGQINLERVGYGLVLHVYDENVAEVAKGIGSIEHFEQVMNIMPPWAHGWPIFARGGWRGKRYRK